jgi:dTMP kinase
MEPMAELFLYEAARVEHLQRVIRPAAREGKVVLCDRFIDATVAYQGYGRGMDLTLIDQIHDRILGEIRPDLTFLLDLPVEEGLRRAWKRMEGQSEKEDRFEKEDLAFHRRVREGYLLLARQAPQRIMILDAMKSVQNLHEDILAHLPAGLRG